MAHSEYVTCGETQELVVYVANAAQQPQQKHLALSRQSPILYLVAR